jgi:hypothetical protein
LEAPGNLICAIFDDSVSDGELSTALKKKFKGTLKGSQKGDLSVPEAGIEINN